MFVKKFEAPSLEQALKLVKTEMGPEALVLSTQERKSGKLFGRRVVEVTAAAEKKSNSSSFANKTQKQADENIVSERGTEKYPSKNNHKGLQGYAAQSSEKKINKSSGQNVKGSTRYIDIDCENINETSKPQLNFRNEYSRFEIGFKTLGISPERSLELSKRIISDFSKTDLADPSFLAKAKSKLLAQGIQTLSASEFFKKRSWVILGAPGSGKTTLTVKLAILAREQEKSVSLISMDNRKFSGRVELAGYARLIKVPFFTEIQQAPQDKLKLIDSPSIHLNEEVQANLEKLCAERSPLLVLDACSRLSELMRQVDKAMVYGPEAIAFTKVDNVEDRGVIYDILKSTQLPLAGVSVASSFKTRFKFMTSTDLAQFLIKE